MTVDPLALPAAPSDWQHSRCYLVFALAIHVAVIALPLSLLPPRPVASPKVIVTFEQPAKLAAPLVLPPPAVEQAAPVSIAERKARQPILTSRKRLAMAQQQVVQAPAFTVAEPEAATAESRPAAVVAPATVPLAAARHDAAYLNNPAPAYPSLSRRLGEEGRVLLKVRVSAEGGALAVNVEKSSNFERLDEAARAVVARWRFVPARRGDEAVESSVVVPVVFRLDA